MECEKTPGHPVSPTELSKTPQKNVPPPKLHSTTERAREATQTCTNAKVAQYTERPSTQKMIVSPSHAGRSLQCMRAQGSCNVPNMTTAAQKQRKSQPPAKAVNTLPKIFPAPLPDLARKRDHAAVPSLHTISKQTAAATRNSTPRINICAVEQTQPWPDVHASLRVKMFLLAFPIQDTAQSSMKDRS